MQTRLQILYCTLPACQNTDQLYFHSFADDPGNEDKLQFYLFMEGSANQVLFLLLPD